MKFPEWVEYERSRARLSLKAFGKALSQADGLRNDGPATQTISNWAESYKNMSYEFRSMIAAYRRQESGQNWTVEHIKEWQETDIEPVPPRERGEGRSLPELVAELKEVADTATKQEAAEILIDVGSVLCRLIQVAVDEPKPAPENPLLTYVSEQFKKAGKSLTEEAILQENFRLPPEDHQAIMDLLAGGAIANSDAIAPLQSLLRRMLLLKVDQKFLRSLLVSEEVSGRSGASKDLA